MRKPALVTAVVVLSLTATGATFAGAKGQAKHHAARALTVFTVTPKDGLAVLPGQAGTFSLGDRVAFSDVVLTSKGGAKLGTDGGACTVTQVTNAATGSGVLLCTVTFSLPGGDIETQALNTLTNGGFSGTQAGSITGGTGKYQNARGQLSIKFLSPTEAAITFHF
jgi:allene oxide cyclase-like protein